MSAKKKGGKLSRSEIVAVRLDPKIKFAVDLAAKKQRRSVSSFIEWAIETTLDELEIASINNEMVKTREVLKQTWDVEESDRFVKLACLFPELLNFQEELLWKKITETPYFWQLNKTNEISDNTGANITRISTSSSVKLEFKNIDVERLRDNWDNLKKIVYEEASPDLIPSEPLIYVD